jgi:hypothetical protein
MRAAFTNSGLEKLVEANGKNWRAFAARVREMQLDWAPVPCLPGCVCACELN